MTVSKEELYQLVSTPPVSRLDFFAEGVHITGAGYGKLIPKIASGRFKIVHDSTVRANRAYYQHQNHHAGSNSLRIHPDLGMASLTARALVLHELTHAMIDNMHLRSSRGLSRTEDEAIAFVVQALYLIVNGRREPHDPVVGPLAFETAHSIVAAGSRYQITKDQMRRLRNAVARHPDYARIHIDGRLRSIRGLPAPSDGI